MISYNTGGLMSSNSREKNRFMLLSYVTAVFFTVSGVVYNLERNDDVLTKVALRGKKNLRNY